ncbi:uncharacterized protein LOC129239493 [Anastrepha obliqua]|uniref:uncharacterized protein LOC129239493 n=1 Tax=Anastrepha obliqua TaxID=95512 RepID=UPI002409F817|nr:uncharacterized protein LOC129239493 [Anastrepha obliqua]
MPDPIPTPTIYAHPCDDVDWKPEQPSEMRKAHRFKGPIYEALLKEFYEDGCYLGARHFEYLVQLEKSLIEREHEIYYVHEERNFLLQLVDNVKAAEQIFRLDKMRGLYVTRKLLYQSMVLVENQRFLWLTHKMYEIIAKYMLRPKTDDCLAMEQSTRFIFKYAKFLMHHGKPEQLTEATILIPVAMEAACVEAWKPDTSPEDEMFSTLHVALGNLLANLYLIKAKQVGITRKHALKRVQKALKAIATVGIKENRCVAFNVFLAKIQLLIDAGRYDWALRELHLLEQSVMKAEGPEFVQHKLDCLKKLGIIYYRLNQPIDAINIYGKALHFCRINNISQAEGDILLKIGDAQRILPGGELRARLAFQMAKTHFQSFGEISKASNTKYLIAGLKSHLISADLKKLIYSKTYCDHYKLRRWKDLCEPFWDEEKQVGYIKKDILTSISMYTSDNLYKLYNLILNTRPASMHEKITKKEEESEESFDLEHVVVKHLYYSNTETAIQTEEGLYEYEYEYEYSSDGSIMEGIERYDSEKIGRGQGIHITNVRKYSASTYSKRSSRKNEWIVKDTDPICCLLREI